MSAYAIVKYMDGELARIEFISVEVARRKCMEMMSADDGDTIEEIRIYKSRDGNEEPVSIYCKSG